MLIQLSRVLSGTARAHTMLHNYVRHVNTPASHVSVTRLVDWKDNRVDEFDAALTPAPGSAF